MRVAGLALMTSESDAASLKMLQSGSTPSVFLDVGVPGPHISNIRVDTRNGMVLAVRHLVNLGHRDILLIRNQQKKKKEPSLLSHRYRDEGFKAAIREFRSLGARARVINVAGPGADAEYKAILSVLKEQPFTAVVAVTDIVALGALHGLHEKGLRIPEDVSVVGFDNTYICKYTHPPLTTIDIPKDELSRIAVELLLSPVRRGESGKEVTLPTKLVVRKSTGLPPARP